MLLCVYCDHSLHDLAFVKQSLSSQKKKPEFFFFWFKRVRHCERKKKKNEINNNNKKKTNPSLFLSLQMSNLRKQILSKTLPPIGPSSSRRSSSDAQKKSAASLRNYTPIEWNNFFEEKRFLTIEENTFCLYSRNTRDSSAPVLFFLHGGGFSGLSWAVLSKAVTDLVQCQWRAIYIRGHGETKTTDENDLRIETITNDICQILYHLYSEDNKPPIFLVGHSMGGALAVHVAKECPTMIDALCVIDVVEGRRWRDSLGGSLGEFR